MHWSPFDLHGILLDIREDIGSMKAQLLDNTKRLESNTKRLESNTQRLDRIDQRLDRERLSLSDLLPFLPGVIVLTLWATGKIDAAAVVGLLSGR